MSGSLSLPAGGRHTPQKDPRPAPGRPGRNTGWQGGRRQGGCWSECGWGHCRGACCPDPHPPIRCPRQRPHWWRCGGSCAGVPRFSFGRMCRLLELRPDAHPVLRPEVTSSHLAFAGLLDVRAVLGRHNTSPTPHRRSTLRDPDRTSELRLAHQCDGPFNCRIFKMLNHVRDDEPNTNVLQALGLITDVKTIAERIKQARLLRGLSQGDLAAKVGVRQSAIGNIESGTRRRPRDLVSIASALSVSPEWLETGKGEEPAVHLPASGGTIAITPLDESTVIKDCKNIQWEDLLKLLNAGDRVPSRFVLPMPDESMSPTTPQGTLLVLERDTPPTPGHGVLIRDAHGIHYIRRYQQASAGRWQAQAANPAYATLQNDQDSLTIVAVVTGRFSGLI